MALEEQASSVSNSTAEGLENIQQKLQYLRTSLDSQMDKLTRLSAENRSWVQALNDIEQLNCGKVIIRIEVLSESDNEDS
ncbi:hypothetical protein FOMG_18320 [Fusarium oxysporum f. sp. melonis 26406]|uniref:Uncharacterized protein n=2 Tax=Fusarium oxysporum TaxID=5507 RepID=W9NQX4_FUSOX|nr:hypothetical protein FOVG_18383 [Fusarium oxysporum f. sp. pisi HDV247]EXA30330.1 hypothetical protein FOVG_18290 [Fusarium oxysporum f. sp. pisi HDV247]EXK24981.1 hypothetical protein FOMG_18320 [Fusarium oxysporum f. sp. melonis 26406]